MNAKTEFSQTIVATVEGRPVTQGELSQAFDLVSNRTNWKLPIDCGVVLSQRQQALVAVAVPFFTGSYATFKRAQSDDVVHVVAAGYYRTIGA